VNQLPSPSSNKTPSFSGTASDETHVTVEIHQGTSEGPIVSSLTAEASSGTWVSDRVPTLPAWGTYTAVATQPSSIGNRDGVSLPMTFIVEPIPPIVVGGLASGVTRDSGSLEAEVNPNRGVITACEFEYGTTTSYGAEAECALSSGGAFTPYGTSAVPVFARVFDLSPSTTYHFRIVAVGEGGTATGSDQTFSTRAPIFNEVEGGELPPSGPAPAHAHGAGGVLSFLAAQLIPSGRRAAIGALLRSGSFAQRFRAPQAGAATIQWYYLPPGTKLARKASNAPVLVATGRRIYGAAGWGVITIHLTPAGRRLLSHAKRIGLTATLAFAPRGHALVRTYAKFRLSR
jgi:hypothetical protein